MCVCKCDKTNSPVCRNVKLIRENANMSNVEYHRLHTSPVQDKLRWSFTKPVQPVNMGVPLLS